MASFDYDMSRSMAGVLGARTRADAVAAFADAYVDMAQYLAPNYADMFERLLRRETPLTVNCSAGKDRTGVAAALILSVLGASRDTVVADYALSQTFVPPALYRDQIRKSAAVSRESAAFAAMPDEAMDVVMGSDPDVMRRALARFDAEFGGPIGLAKTRYGLDDAKIARLRTLYLG
jgi:protein-tyrosine phosphatase